MFEESHHEYEDMKDDTLLRKLQATHSAGEFHVTPCPAYIPTTTSAAVDAVYDVVSSDHQALAQRPAIPVPHETAVEGNRDRTETSGYVIVSL